MCGENILTGLTNLGHEVVKHRLHSNKGLF